MSIKTWCIRYLAVALSFDTLSILGLINNYTPLNNLLIGPAAGATTDIGLHIKHHINEENQHSTIMN